MNLIVRANPAVPYYNMAIAVMHHSHVAHCVKTIGELNEVSSK